MKKFLEELEKIAGSERRAVYGEPAHHFARSAKIKEAIRAAVRPVDPELDHVLDMIADKMARLAQSPNHKDSWLDVAGYAMNAYEILHKRKEGQEVTSSYPYRPGQHYSINGDYKIYPGGPAHGMKDACQNIGFMWGKDPYGNDIVLPTSKKAANDN